MSNVKSPERGNPAISTIRWESALVELEPDPVAIATGLAKHGAALAGRFAEAKVAGAKVAGLAWTVHQLAAHVAATAENYAKVARGDHVVAQPLSERQQVIDGAIAERIHVGVPDLAEAIDRHTSALATHLRGSDPESLAPYYGSTRRFGSSPGCA